MTHRFGTLAILTSSLIAACGGQRAPAAEPQAPVAGGQVEAAPGRAYASGYAEPGAETPAPTNSPASAYRAGGAPRDEAEQAKAEESRRPGLGTAWGEQRASRVSTTSFVRDGESPFGTASFFYNDETGIAAMTRGRYVDWSDSVTSLGHGITVTIAEPGGAPLRAARVDDRVYAIGRDGDRYVIRVENRSPVRLEAVATVDGLDVVDGQDGDLSKRGYVIGPNDSIEIEGFRESEGTVRAFRFGATSDSYASRRGKGRNVGVIGIALFQERGSDWRWTPDEVERRQTADPFPGRYAPAPPPSHYRAH